MSDDDLAGFRRSVRATKAKPPSLKSRSLDFEKTFSEVAVAVDAMSRILDEEQPTSNVAYIFSEYNQDDDSLFINIRGERDVRINSVLIFSYQNGSVHALNNNFKDANKNSSCVWFSADQKDLTSRIIRHFAAFFSKQE